MSSLEHILFRSPWVPYNNQFIQSRITLTYPENVIFTAQFLKHLSQLNVYKDYPYAERFDYYGFEQIDWKRALIIFDRDLRLVFAPDLVYQLVQLDRRLHFREAAAAIFSPFRFFPAFEVFRHQWVGIFAIFLLYALNWLVSKRGRDYYLVLSSKPLARSPDPGR